MTSARAGSATRACAAAAARARHRVRVGARLLARRRRPPDQLARHGAARAADEQPVPHRARPRRRLRHRLRPAHGGSVLATTRTRLDAALDAAVAVAAVADVLGDRCGAIAFAGEVLRRSPPRRAGARDVVSRALRPRARAGRQRLRARVRRSRAASSARFVLVLTDLLEEAAARPLVEALPVLARRHAVVVAASADPDLDAPALRAAGRRRVPRGRRARRPRGPRARRRPVAARGRDGHRGAAGDPRRRLRQGVSASEVDGSSLAFLTRPRQSTSPQKTRRGRRRCRSPRRGRPPPGWRGSPRRSRRSPARAPSRATRSSASRASRCSETRRVRSPGETIDQPRLRPAAPPTRMHESSSTPCAVTRSTKPTPFPACPISPPITPSSSAVVEEGDRSGDPARDAARERHERDLDVVREDLRREGALCCAGVRSCHG